MLPRLLSNRSLSFGSDDTIDIDGDTNGTTAAAAAAITPPTPPTIQQRLEALVALSTNRSCADCPNPNATWASLLVPPPGTTDRARLGKAQKSMSRWSSGAAHRHNIANSSGGMPYKLGVLCCVQCYLHHAQLGKQICRVKNTQKVEDCTFFVFLPIICIGVLLVVFFWCKDGLSGRMGCCVFFFRFFFCMLFCMLNKSSLTLSFCFISFMLHSIYCNNNSLFHSK